MKSATKKGMIGSLTKPDFIIQHILYNSVNRNPRTPCHCFCTLIWLTFLDLAKTGRIRFLPIVKTQRSVCQRAGVNRSTPCVLWSVLTSSLTMKSHVA